MTPQRAPDALPAKMSDQRSPAVVASEKLKIIKEGTPAVHIVIHGDGLRYEGTLSMHAAGEIISFIGLKNKKS